LLQEKNILAARKKILVKKIVHGCIKKFFHDSSLLHQEKNYGIRNNFYFKRKKGVCDFWNYFFDQSKSRCFLFFFVSNSPIQKFFYLSSLSNDLRLIDLAYWDVK